MPTPVNILRRIWPSKIRSQLILGMALVHLILMSIFVADLLKRQYSFLLRQSQDQALGLANDLAINANVYITGNDFDGLEQVIQSYKDFPHLEYAMVLSPDNMVLAHTDAAYVGKAVADSISLGMGNQVRSHILARDNHVLDVAAPVIRNKTLIGWARVAINQEYIYGNLAAIVQNGILYILMAILVGTIVAILIGNRLTGGLYKLVTASEKIRSGDRSLRAARSGGFELDLLATAFNQMLDDIGSNESLLKNAFDFSAIGMAISTLEGRWTKLNRALCRMLGYTETELLTMDFRRVTHPDDLQENLSQFTQLQQGKIDRYRLNKRYFHKNGTLVWAHLTVSAVKDQQGNPLYVVAQVEDISDIVESQQANKEAEMALRDSEEKFRSLVEQSQVGVYILQDEKFVYINPVFEKQSGYSKEEIIGIASFDMLIHEEDAPRVRRSYEQRMSGERSTDRYILRAIRRDGSIIFLEAIVSTIVYNNRPASIGSVIDITDRLEEENRINKAVIEAQDRERMQIGMELHDNVQQIMAGSVLTLDYIRSCYDDREQALQALENVRRYINEGIIELRRLSHQLAPDMRISESLAEKIHALVQNMNAGSGIDVEVEVDDFDIPLDDEVQLAFYRILQEQFTNILKYAAASRVSIRVKKRAGQIVLSIRDNGRGFDPAEKSAGIGLENIRRRATAMDGELKILSAAGAGCEISLQVPTHPPITAN